jgi:hypothetical protein
MMSTRADTVERGCSGYPDLGSESLSVEVVCWCCPMEVMDVQGQDLFCLYHAMTVV